MYTFFPDRVDSNSRPYVDLNNASVPRPDSLRREAIGRQMVERARASRKRKSRSRSPQTSRRQRSNLNDWDREEHTALLPLHEQARVFLTEHPDSPGLEYPMSPLNYDQEADDVEVNHMQTDSSSEESYGRHNRKESTESVEIYTEPIDFVTLSDLPIDDRSSSESLSLIPEHRLFAILTTDLNDAGQNYFDSFHVSRHGDSHSSVSKTLEVRSTLLESERSGASAGLPRMRDVIRFVGNIDNHPLPHRFNGRMHPLSTQSLEHDSPAYTVIQGHLLDVQDALRDLELFENEYDSTILTTHAVYRQRIRDERSDRANIWINDERIMDVCGLEDYKVGVYASLMTDRPPRKYLAIHEPFTRLCHDIVRTKRDASIRHTMRTENHILHYANPFYSTNADIRVTPINRRIYDLRIARGHIVRALEKLARLFLTPQIREVVDSYSSQDDTRHFFYHHCPYFRYLDDGPVSTQGFQAMCLHSGHRLPDGHWEPRSPLLPINPILTWEDDEFLYHVGLVFDIQDNSELANTIHDIRDIVIPFRHDVYRLLDHGFLDPLDYFDEYGYRRAIVFDATM